MNEEEIKTFLLSVKSAVDADDMSKADELLTEEALSQYPHPYTFLYKCIIDRHFEREASAVLATAEQGLRLSPTFADLIDFKFIALLALGDYARAAESWLMLCT